MSSLLKKSLTLLSLATLLGSGSAMAAEYSVLVEVMPGSVLLSSEFGDYQTIKTDDGTQNISEEFKNGAAYLPTASVGFEIDTDYWRYQLLGGIGQIQNESYKATVLKYEAAMYYTGGLQSGFAFGPHVVNYNIMSPSWEGDTEFTLSGTNAIAPGLAFTVGDRFVIKGSVDYLMGATMDVQAKNGYTHVAGDDLELEGVVVQLGAMMRF